jgi:hypothetical protein
MIGLYDLLGNPTHWATRALYFIYIPNRSGADYINNHILNVFKYMFNIQLIIKL